MSGKKNKVKSPSSSLMKNSPSSTLHSEIPSTKDVSIVSSSSSTTPSMQLSSFKTVHVIFQSKSSSETECFPNRILMNQSDIKSMNIRTGSLVIINDHIVSRLWPSKQQISGYSVLNNVWSPNFDKNIKSRMTSISLVTSEYSVMISQRISMTYSRSNHERMISQFDDFKLYVKGLLIGVQFLREFSWQITWKGKPLVINISDVSSAISKTSNKSNSDENDEKIIFSIDDSTDIHVADELSSISKILLTKDINQTIESTLHDIQNEFGGYPDVLYECISFLQLAIDNHESNNNNDNNKNKKNKNRLVYPKGLLITGASGTGKSKLMRTLTSYFNLHCIEITPSILTHKYHGDAERELTEVFKQAHSHPWSCILVDDIDLLFPDRNTCSDEQKRLVSSLLSLMDDVSTDVTASIGVTTSTSSMSIIKKDNNHTNRVLFIATSSRPHFIDSALRRPGRIDKEVELVVPSNTDRYSILKRLLLHMNIPFAVDGSHISMDGLKMVADTAHGMVASDLLLVIKEAYLLAYAYHRIESQDIKNMIDSFHSFSINNETTTHDISVNKTSVNERNVMISDENLLKALHKVSPSALREVAIEVPNVKWEDIGGMNDVKQSLKEVVEWPLLYPHLFESMGISPPRGVLLYGPPGCSKTLMAKALATESSMNFLAVRGPELLSKWLGESEKAIQTLFRRARAVAPSIIFFDEIDALTGKRGESSSGVNDRVLSQLLTEIDGVQTKKRVVVIAATNRPDLMDLALLRPGRIDRKIYVGPPDRESREQIFQLQLKKVPIFSDIDYDVLVERSKGFSGAEVVSICTEAAYLAMDKNDMMIQQGHLLEVIENMKPQITPDMILFYERIQLDFKI